MKLRFKNITKKPREGSPDWIIFVTKYPFIFLLPLVGLLSLGWHFYTQLQLLEEGNTDRVYLGKLYMLYEILGKEGVLGIFILVSMIFLYLFWYYALSD